MICQGMVETNLSVNHKTLLKSEEIGASQVGSELHAHDYNILGKNLLENVLTAMFTLFALYHSQLVLYAVHATTTFTTSTLWAIPVPFWNVLYRGVQISKLFNHNLAPIASPLLYLSK